MENLYRKNKSLFERVLDKLKEFVKNLREYFAHVNPNTKVKAAALKENTENGMRYLEKIVEAFDKTAEAAVENYQQGTTESTAESKTQYKTRGKYWRPDLKDSEWKLLERRMAEEIGSGENYLDDATKWVYADEKGAQVFALYGVGNGTEATPLYAVGGKQATEYNVAITEFVERSEKYDRDGRSADALSELLRRKKRSRGGNISQASRKAGDAGTVLGLSGGSQRSDAGGTAGRGTENQRGVKEKFSLREIGGKVMPVLDVQNDTRDYKVAEAYLKTLVNTEHPFATILMDAQPVYIGKDLPGEYKGSEYTHGLNRSTRQVKMQAATNLDEMLLLAENGEWRENVKDKHKKDAKNGWYRYSTQFALPVLDIKKAVDHYTVYSGTLIIRNDADGKSYLYDLLDIKKEKVISSPSFSARERSEVFEPKPSREQYMQNPQKSQQENTGKDQRALRDVALSDRDVLRGVKKAGRHLAMLADFGAEGGSRTLARVFKPPTPLAGEPLRPLGYFCRNIWRSLAERVGFEPTDAFTSPVFKTGAFDHSAISPCVKVRSTQTQELFYHRGIYLSTKNNGRKDVFFKKMC